MNADMNFWAILVCAVASMVTGFLWYGPLFSKAWMKEMGWDPNNTDQMRKMQHSAKTAYIQQFIGSLIMAYVFAAVLQAFETTGVGMSLFGAVMTWIGFIAPIKYGDTLWGKSTIKLFFIDSFYYLLNLLVFAVILTLWN